VRWKTGLPRKRLQLGSHHIGLMRLVHCRASSRCLGSPVRTGPSCREFTDHAIAGVTLLRSSFQALFGNSRWGEL